MQTAYEILGVDPYATDAEIRKQFLALMLVNHPDKSTNPNAKKNTQQILNAFQLINTTEKRQKYDREQNIGPNLSAVSEELRRSPSMFFYDRSQSCPGLSSERRRKAKFADDLAETFAERDDTESNAFTSSCPAMPTLLVEQAEQSEVEPVQKSKKAKKASDDNELLDAFQKKLSVN